MRTIGTLPYGGTDCALPMIEALRHRWMVDAFIVVTDRDTWAGNVSPLEALQLYRQRTGIGAKLIVIGLASQGFSLADPSDGGMLDLIGFDAYTPRRVHEFVLSPGLEAGV